MRFEEKVEHYFELLKEKREEADLFYKDELMADVCERFSNKVDEYFKSNSLKKVKNLIVTVGFSPEPLIMLIEALKPEKIFFICEQQTTRMYDYIVEKTGIKASQFKNEIFDNPSVIDIYEAIRKITQEPAWKNSLSETVVDITGGKKSMVSGCTLAANYLGVKVSYIDYEGYNDKFRKPIPGSEYLSFLPDPIEVFGDKALKNAMIKFNSGNFNDASEVFQSIKLKVSMPKKYEVLEALSNSYQAMEDMRLKEAYEGLNSVLIDCEKFKITDHIDFEQIKRNISGLLPLKNLPQKQLSLKLLFKKPQVFWYFSAYLLELSRYYMDIKKNDLASLLSYRTLELLIQYLLHQNGIDASNAKYEGHNEMEILESYRQQSKEVNPNYPEPKELPRKIGLISGVMILKAIKDPSVESINTKKIEEKTEIRNKSRFAHGLNIVDYEEAKAFYHTVCSVFKEVRIKSVEESDEERLKDICSSFKFIKLKE